MQFNEMEERIKRMESAIITSGLHGTAEPMEEREEEKSLFDKIESQTELSNHLSNLVVDPGGSPNFIGWASGFSLLSPQGLQWISEKVGNKDELAQLGRKMSKSDYVAWGSGNIDLWYPVPRSQCSPLPSKSLALQYVNCFFTTFNDIFPIINRKVFGSYFERQYSTTPPVGTGWYALFNAILCIGSIRTNDEREGLKRSSRLIDYTSDAKEIGVKYFRNASSCFHELFFGEANLMAIQAMTLMVFITTSSPNPQPAYVLTSAVGSLANTLGLHRSLDGFGLTPEEIEQRRNVFWVFYLIEKAVSHNLGRPSIINDDDIAIDLPSKNSGLIQSTSGAKVYDIFHDQVMLAIIGSRICGELYSASSQTKSEMDRMKVLGKLDNHLQRWRDAIPLDIRPEHPIKCSDEQYVPVVMMHLIYLDLVILLHRLSSHQISFQDDDSMDIKSHDYRARLNPRVYASRSLCLAAARRSIRLLDTLSSKNQQNQHLMWFVASFPFQADYIKYVPRMALYYPLSASLVLFANILSNPQDRNAPSDVRLMNLIMTFIARFVQPETSFATTPTVALFKELYDIAKRLVARVSLQPTRKVKRMPEGDEPAQSDLLSSSNIPAVLERPLSSVVNTQTTTSSAPHDATYSGTDIPMSKPSPVRSGEHIFQEDHNVQSSPSDKPSRESTGDSPLEFAPFIPPESSQFDYIPMIDDSLLSSASFEWDVENLWMPSPESDLWLPTDLIESNWEPDII
ncbi:fungal-specific transcription factor domain-containing protein [Xylogone sp. PMI_703]|nr:fungal-specific transcription factor domain-containing protein [Xylogone sp. PMI_703]